MAKAGGAGRRPRDARLDFFRGLAMFIILIAHIPSNWWALWIPARFGFSDAAEIFVFCSGMASALAFGTIFRDQSWFIGAARIAQRVWQIYWAHIGLFLTTFFVVASADALIEGADYVGQLNLMHLVDRPLENFIGLMTLTYVPNFFDMLPMYIGVLVMVPFVAYLGNVRPLYAGVFVVLVWLAATFGLAAPPAEPWSDRPWFFNPLGWQLVFFTGFAFASGWLKPPKRDRRLIALAIVIVLAAIPFARFEIYQAVGAFREVREAIWPLIAKTDFGLLRYVHFLAIAYLGYCIVGEKGRRLPTEGFWGRVVDVIRMVGQQSLAVFVTSIVLSQILGVVLTEVGRTNLSMTVVNLFGFCILIATAAIVRWYKNEPWRRPRPQPATPRESVDPPIVAEDARAAAV